MAPELDPITFHALLEVHIIHNNTIKLIKLQYVICKISILAPKVKSTKLSLDTIDSRLVVISYHAADIISLKTYDSLTPVCVETSTL